MQRIPRGVADDDRLAVVATRAGELIALDPGTGAVRWRQGRGLRPCAVTATAVVALRRDDPDGPAVVVLDKENGRELWTVSLPAVPEWADQASTDDPSFSLDCTVEGEQVLLRWTATSRYRGGAAPSARALHEHTRDAHGAVRVDLPSRSLEPAAPGDLVAGVQEQGLAATASGHLDADVLDAGRVGNVRVELATPAATDAVVLRGVDVADDAVIWELVLDPKVRRPPPLRP
jgi:hypothetical protein